MFSGRAGHGVLIAVIVAATLAACGGGESTTKQEQTYIDASAAEIVKGKAAKDLGVKRRHAECTAEAVIKVLDAKQMAADGMTAKKFAKLDDVVDYRELTDDELQELGDKLSNCELGELFAPEMAKTFGGKKADRACVAKVMNDSDAGHVQLAIAVTGTQMTVAQAKDLLGALRACIDFEAWLLDEADLKLSDEERACVLNDMTTRDVFVDGVAKSLAGKPVSDAENQAVFLPSLEKCAPGRFKLKEPS